MRFSYKQLLRTFFPPSPDERLIEATEPAVFVPTPHPAGQRTTALLTYRVPAVRAAIHLAKFHHHSDALRLLRGTLATYLAQQPAHTIVPIPLSRKRYRERGYNQVVEILRTVPVSQQPLLVRHRHTLPQADLPRSARLHNLTGAFAINHRVAKLVAKDTPLLVLDDVSTTGSTLREAAETLRRAGYTNVHCLALAH